MKKILLIVLTVVSLLPVFGQNGVNNGSLFLLQKDLKTISVNLFENNRIVEVKDFRITKKSIYTTDQQSFVAILDISKNSVVLIDIYSSNQISFSIPFYIKPKTILLNNNNLFIGGEMGKEILIQYNLENKEWYVLEIPKEVEFVGKAVDDLLVNDSLLIAIDNLIMPKYVLYYDLNSKEKLSFSHFKKLKSNSSYESIHQARITSDYIGLFSTTINEGAISEHLTFYNDIDLFESFAITIDTRKNFVLRDFIVVGDKVFIANSQKGLGIFRIKRSYFKRNEHKYDIFNTQVNENLINYENIKKGEIVKLTRIPHELKIILTIKDSKGKIRNELRSID